MSKNTGGSAFPGGLFETASCGQNDRMPYNDGMTLLDYFATHADISKELEYDSATLSTSLAVKLMKDQVMPAWTEDFEGALMWWYEAEARLRYIKATAMIRARESV